jgi:hypothetical protein
MTDNSKSVSLSGTMKARLRKYGNLEIELCNCSSPNKLILTAFEAKGLGELLAPQAASGEARCKFCQQLPNMEGDCRCDLDPPQAASDSVTISRELFNELVYEIPKAKNALAGAAHPYPSPYKEDLERLV